MLKIHINYTSPSISMNERKEKSRSLEQFNHYKNRQIYLNSVYNTLYYCINYNKGEQNE